MFEIMEKTKDKYDIQEEQSLDDVRSIICTLQTKDIAKRKVFLYIVMNLF